MSDTNTSISKIFIHNLIKETRFSTDIRHKFINHIKVIHMSISGNPSGFLSFNPQNISSGTVNSSSSSTPFPPLSEWSFGPDTNFDLNVIQAVMTGADEQIITPSPTDPNVASVSGGDGNGAVSRNELLEYAEGLWNEIYSNDSADQDTFAYQKLQAAIFLLTPIPDDINTDYVGITPFNVMNGNATNTDPNVHNPQLSITHVLQFLQNNGEDSNNLSYNDFTNNNHPNPPGNDPNPPSTHPFESLPVPRESDLLSKNIKINHKSRRSF